MKKKLIAIAVFAVLTTPVTAKPMFKFYGQLQVEVAQQNKAGVNETVVDDSKRGRLGVMASEDLGDGLTAIAHFEWQVDTSDADANDGRRIALVGLKGSFGKFVTGSLMSPYKYTGGVKYDPFVTTFLEARSNGGMSGFIESALAANATGTLNSKGAFGHHNFVHNAIGYSIKNKTLSFKSVYSPDEQGDAQGSSGDYAISAKYNSGPMEAFIAASNDDSSELSGAKFGGRYMNGKYAILGQYEKVDAAGTNVDVAFLGFHYMLGKNMLVAQFGNTSIDKVDTPDITYYALGIVHKFSKKTRIFTGYRNTDKGGSIKDTAFTVGLRVDFDSGI